MRRRNTTVVDAHSAERLRLIVDAWLLRIPMLRGHVGDHAGSQRIFVHIRPACGGCISLPSMLVAVQYCN